MTGQRAATPAVSRRAPSLAWPIVRDAAAVVVASVLIALAANALRSSGRIPLVAREPYQVLVPCPEHQGTASSLAASAVDVSRRNVVLVDARSGEDFGRWHLPGALSIPFDYLEPVSRQKVREVLDRRPQQVVVYGDGEDPDSGEQLARQIAGAGVKNVHFVKGGAPALRDKRGGR